MTYEKPKMIIIDDNQVQNEAYSSVILQAIILVVVVGVVTIGGNPPSF